ncbi:MAG: NusA-like transcription termination signal-binding factor [Candidatus Baldrarchaeia archaeon]
MTSSKIRLTTEEIRYISLFETFTRALVKDCVIDENMNRLIFVVKAGDLGLAIGKRGENIKRIKQILKKDIDVVEYSDKPEEFIKNALMPARIKSVHITERKDGRKVAIVTVDPKYKGLAIGKNGKNVAKARILAKRHFGIDDVIIE